MSESRLPTLEKLFLLYIDWDEFGVELGLAPTRGGWRFHKSQVTLFFCQVIITKWKRKSTGAVFPQSDLV